MKKRGAIRLGVPLFLALTLLLLILGAMGCTGSSYAFDIINTSVCMEAGGVTRICSTANGCLEVCKRQICPKEDLAFDSAEFSSEYNDRKCICHCEKK